MDIIHWDCDVDPDNKQILQSLLPQQYQYQVSKFLVYPSKHPEIIVESQFYSDFDVRACGINQVNEFLTQFQKTTSTTYNKSKADVDSSKWSNTVEFSGFRKCHHLVKKQINLLTGQIKKDKTPGKNQNCKSRLKFTLKKHNCQGQDDCQEFALNIKLDYQHSHNIDCSQANSFHPVAPETKIKFQEYFESGLSASAAFDRHKAYLREKYENYNIISSNRSLLPDYPWIFNAHTAWLKWRFGTLDGPDSMLRTKTIIDKLNAENGCTPGKEYVKMIQRPDGHYIVCIVDQFHRRIHEVNN